MPGIRETGARVQAGELDGLVGKIYQAATDQDSVDTLAAAFARAFGSESCLLYFCSESPGRMPDISGILAGSSNFTNEALAAYAGYYHERNVWYERGWKKGLPAIVLGQELIDTPSLLRTEWSDFLRDTDAFKVLGAQFRVAGNRLGLIGIHRPRKGRDFDEADRRRMAFLMPHYQRALQLRERLALAEHRGNLALELLDRLAVGVIFVTGDCRVLFANGAAERVLRRGDGLAVSGGVLNLPGAGRGRLKFERMVAEAARTGMTRVGGAGGVFQAALPAGGKLPLLISPMLPEQAAMMPVQPVAAVIFSEPDSAVPDARAYFAWRYALTPAESRLLVALISGAELAAYAQEAGVRPSTVKTHLKNLFAKIGCRRQADIVRTVLSDPMSRLVFRAPAV